MVTIDQVGKYYDKKDAATALGLAPSTISKYLLGQHKEKRLDGVSLGRMGWLIHENELRRFAREYKIRVIWI